jgi:hypothetical protein
VVWEAIVQRPWKDENKISWNISVGAAQKVTNHMGRCYFNFLVIHHLSERTRMGSEKLSEVS